MCLSRTHSPLHQYPIASSYTAEDIPQTPVALQGSALLITWYAGVTWALRKGGLIVPGQTSLSGLSGGGYLSVLNVLGFTGPEQREMWIEAVLDIGRRGGGSAGFLNAIVETHIYDILPADAIAKINGTVRIAFSQLDASKPYLNNSASWVVNEFENNRNLVSALTATDYIPCYSGLNVYTVRLSLFLVSFDVCIRDHAKQ